jgi:predicted HicB family RNase H-like nuclease
MKRKLRENVTVRMLPKLHQSLQIASVKERRSMSDLVEDAVEKYLSNQSTNHDRQTA